MFQDFGIRRFGVGASSFVLYGYSLAVVSASEATGLFQQAFIVYGGKEENVFIKQRSNRHDFKMSAEFVGTISCENVHIDFCAFLKESSVMRS